jgi:hypothetical protein
VNTNGLRDLLPEIVWVKSRVRRHPDVAKWQWIAWCLLLALLVSLVANGTLGWIIYAATRPL